MYMTVMMGVVKTIKYIHNRVLHLRVFEVLCERMGLQHHHLIFYAEVIRFWRGRVLAQMHDLESQLKTKKRNFISCLQQLVHLMNFRFSCIYSENSL